MHKILVLADDIDLAKDWLISANINNLYILDDLAVNRDLGLNLDPDDPDFGSKILVRLAALSKNFKAKRPLAIVTNTKNISALDIIAHDLSVTMRSENKKKRLGPRHKTDITIENISEISRLTDMLQTLL